MTTERPTTPAPVPLEYEPGIDGLRAVAVIAVLLYHARFSWIPGGFLGVSMFFTLSGFLITSLLLREHARSGRVSLGRFWSRRYRRLLPASLAVQAGIVVMALAGVWNDDQMDGLRTDALAALAQVANWHFILGERSYGTSFAAPSPFEHYWSLAIEEQFYLLFPLLVVGLLRVGRGRLGPLLGTLVALTALSAGAAAWLAAPDVNRAYFGTDTRLAELTVGAIAACLTLHRIKPTTPRGRWITVGASYAGLGAVAVLAATATVGSSWLYPGGLLITSLATIALIGGSMTPGPVKYVLTSAPAVFVGRISYGIYLIHWPIFLWLTPVRTGWSPVPLFGLRVAVTVGLATVMYQFLEHPVRTRQFLVQPPIARVSVIGAAMAVAATAVVATHQTPPPTGASTQGFIAATETTSTSPPRPQRVLVVGDQLAGSLGPGLQAAGSSTLDVRTESLADCGVVVAGFVKVTGAGVERDTRRCRHGATMFQLAEAEFRPDVVVIWTGVRDAVDRRLSASSPWITPSDDSFADLYRTSLGDLVDSLGSGGARVVVLDVPVFDNRTPPGPLPPPDPADPADEDYETTQLEVAAVGAPPTEFAENDPARTAALNGLIDNGVAGRDFATALDIVAELRARSDADVDPLTRPDGVVPEPVTAIGLGSWLRSQISDMERRTAAPPTVEAPSSLTEVSLPAAPPAAPRTTAPPGRPVRALVVGDSVAWGYATGLNNWGEGGGSLTVASVARFACPLARGGQYRYLREINEFDPDCDWSPRLWTALEEGRPDVVLLTTGIWDVADRLLPAADRWRHVGQDDYDNFVLSELLAAIDLAGSLGARVAVMTYPHFEAGRDQGYVGLPESDPARIDRLNDLMREAVELRPGVATTVDFQQWLGSEPGGELDPAKRIDGLHFSDAYLDEIAGWLAPQLVRIARE